MVRYCGCAREMKSNAINYLKRLVGCEIEYSMLKVYVIRM